MQEYRAYVVDDDGHFLSFEQFLVANDDAAIERAKRMVIGHDIELWNLDRFVVKLSPKPAPDAPGG